MKQHAPSTFKWRGQSADKDVIIGGDEAIFAPVYGPPKIHLKSEIKTADESPYSMHLSKLADYRELVALCDESDYLQSTGFMLCFVHDIEEKKRHLEMAKAHLELSKKPFMGAVMSEQALNEVAALVGKKTQPNECNLLHMINSSPPLRYQQNTLRCIRAAALLGEGILMTSYSMMGATSPVTVAGTIAQGYAELLVGLALSQLYTPGLPVVFGLYGIPFSMSSMIPMYGHYNSSMVQLISSQLARNLEIPSRGEGNVTSSKIDDAQAGYEGGASMSAALAANADFYIHTAGWLHNGICTSPSKLIREAKALENLYLRKR